VSDYTVFPFLFKGFRKMKRTVIGFGEDLWSYLVLLGNKVDVGENVSFNGVPFVEVNKKGNCTIGDGCTFNSKMFYNPIGRNQRCQIVVGENAVLTIGNTVGVSSSAIICYDSITIGNNVKIGGNTVIYDSDFHSLDFLKRRTAHTDLAETKPVIIGDDVFIGAHVTILKGVHIGPRAVVAAGSVITKDIPAEEIWGGNPGRKIR
jgi:acetyltransferase-like isoleucine patch superfamily enzyme